ncbi:MAG: hypothetical protein RLZZ584_2443 [Pseudomonadota bacterium]
MSSLEHSHPVRILIVDDEPVVRQAYGRILRNGHHVVDAASNGTDALRLMAAVPYDVVLLDLRMPGMDGLSVLRALRQGWPACEVIIITGQAALDTAKASVALGAYDYLAKPVDPDEVVSATRGALLHKGWAAQALAA